MATCNGNGNGHAKSNGANGTNGHANDLAGIGHAEPRPRRTEIDQGDQPGQRGQPVAGWEKGFIRLLLKADGILFEDGQLQVGVRSEYRGQMACLILYFTNKTPAS